MKVSECKTNCKVTYAINSINRDSVYKRWRKIGLSRRRKGLRGLEHLLSGFIKVVNSLIIQGLCELYFTSVKNHLSQIKPIAGETNTQRVQELQADLARSKQYLPHLQKRASSRLAQGSHGQAAH